MNSGDQYLRTLYVLEASGSDPVPTGKLAERLDVSPASVTEMIGKLEDHGYVEREKYRGASLTDQGRERAEVLLEKYCILERFLANVLDVDPYREEATALEGVVDDLVVDRLDTIIERASDCPECFDPQRMECSCLTVTERAD